MHHYPYNSRTFEQKTKEKKNFTIKENLNQIGYQVLDPLEWHNYLIIIPYKAES